MSNKIWVNSQRCPPVIDGFHTIEVLKWKEETLGAESVRNILRKGIMALAKIAEAMGE